MSFWKKRNKPEEHELATGGIKTLQSDHVGSEFPGKSAAAGFAPPSVSNQVEESNATSAVNSENNEISLNEAAERNGGIGIKPVEVNVTPRPIAVKVDRDKTIGVTSPWVKMSASDAYKQYEDLTPAQYLRDLTAYKRAGDEDLSYADIVSALDGRNPNKPEKDLKKERRRERAATAVNALGTVLAHLVNYGRTKAGHPAMRLAGVEDGERRIDEMRRRRQAMDRNAYETYLGMIDAERKERAAKVAADLKWQQQLALEQMKQNSPLERERINTEKVRQRSIGANVTLSQERANGVRLDNEHKPKKQQAELDLYEARRRQALASAAKSGSERNKKFIEVYGADGNSVKYSPDVDGEGYIQKAYRYIINSTGGDKSPYKIKKMNSNLMSGNTGYYDNEMLDVIARYNADMETKMKERNYERGAKNEKSPYNLKPKK